MAAAWEQGDRGGVDRSAAEPVLVRGAVSSHRADTPPRALRHRIDIQTVDLSRLGYARIEAEQSYTELGIR